MSGGIVIGVDGSSNSGKTLLVRELAKRLDGKVCVITETAREVFYEHFHDFKTLDDLRANPRVYYEFQKIVLLEQIHRETVARELYEITLSDRTIFSVFLYAYSYLPIKYVAKLFDDFERFVDKYDYEGYDAVVILSPIEKFVNDGFRSENDYKLAEAHFDVLKNMVVDSDLAKSIRIVETTDFDERVKNVLEYIDNVR